MSGLSSRVLAFVQRAQELTSNPAKSPSRTPPRSITPQKAATSRPPPVPAAISPLKSMKDPVSSALSDSSKSSIKLARTVPAKRVSPQKSVTPRAKPAPQPIASNKPRTLTPKSMESKNKTIGIESLTEIESLVENLMKTRQTLDEKIKEQQDKEFEVINMIKESLNKTKKEEQFESVQQAEM
jgi:hypothetical protein